MRRALKLAQRGRGAVSPNPRVGAVIVASEGTILGKGYHRKFGDLHAEAAALATCREKDISGATMVVNLEPCCHYGKTPPCTESIINSGIKRVVVAIKDPDPRMNGNGIKTLQEAGIDVEYGILNEEAQYVNRGYLSTYIRGRAWCAVKVALSIDGRMANLEGQSKWITGQQARKMAHALRADHDAVLVGGGTVHHDNPELTVRMVKGPNPVRVILSSHYGIPHDSKLAYTAKQVPLILIASESSEPQGLDIENLKVLRFKERKDGSIDPADILQELPKHGIMSLLVEGGSGVLSSFIQAGVVDEISVGIAPSVIGTGISPFEKFVPDSWEWRPRYLTGSVKRLGSDIVITYRRGEELFSPD